MSHFLKNLESKAKSAINATPLKQYVPGLEGTQSGSSAPRSYTLDAIHHQLRSLQLQYGSSGGKDVRQLQLIITGQKGLILDLDKQAQDTQAVSKEYYLWGQTEDADIRDVTDRLAYLTYVQGSLAASLASSFDAARAPFKALRDAETALQPKRSAAKGYDMQISRLKNENKPGTEAKIKELEMMLDKEIKQIEPHEKEMELLKRKAIIDSEKIKWDAIREYGEKLVLLSEASKPVLEALPSVPPSTTHHYAGAASTAAARTTLQKALDNWKPGDTKLPIPTGADSDTRSFGETHARELSRIPSVADRPPPPGRKASPTIGHFDTPGSIHTPPSASSHPEHSQHPVDPNLLNQASAPTPSMHSHESISATSPTIAETGVPVVAGKDGPGPSSGSLAKLGQHDNAPQPGYGESVPAYGVDIPRYGLNDSENVDSSQAPYVSAEEEKRRLERAERDKVLSGHESAAHDYGVSDAGPSGSYETAEEEKKRLAREEQERALASQSSEAQVARPARQGTLDPDIPEEGNTPPPYEEPKF